MNKIYDITVHTKTEYDEIEYITLPAETREEAIEKAKARVYANEDEFTKVTGFEVQQCKEVPEDTYYYVLVSITLKNSPSEHTYYFDFYASKSHNFDKEQFMKYVRTHTKERIEIFIQHHKITEEYDYDITIEDVSKEEFKYSITCIL